MRVPSSWSRYQMVVTKGLPSLLRVLITAVRSSLRNCRAHGERVFAIKKSPSFLALLIVRYYQKTAHKGMGNAREICYTSYKMKGKWQFDTHGSVPWTYATEP